MGNSKQIWSVVFFLAFVVALVFTIYFWATMLVWIPLLVLSFYFFYCDIRREDQLPYYYSWHLQGFVYGAGAVSMIWQYFYTPIIWGLRLWECLVILGVVVILFAIAIDRSNGGSRARRRERRREAQRRAIREQQLDASSENFPVSQ